MKGEIDLHKQLSFVWDETCSVDTAKVKVSKDSNEEWIPVVKKRRKRACKRKEDESELLMTVVMS